MKYSVCIDAVYGKKPFAQTVSELSRLGFDRFEFWTWWDKDLDALSAESRKAGLSVSAMCTKFLSLVDPASHPAYLDGLAESIRAAKRIGCSKLITQVGNDTGVSRAEQADSLVAGLTAAIPLLEKESMTLLVEPLNVRVDHGGYFLSSSDEAFEILGRVDSESVKLLFDIYHQQITEGDIIRRINANIDRIGHFHAAGCPGRRELDDGELNYVSIFAAIEALGFKGDVGLEYFPAKDPGEGLKAWVRP
jgi:hydroxypyruvate isomerase